MFSFRPKSTNQCYPLKLKLQNNQKLLIYFDKKQDRKVAYRKVLQEQGFMSPLDQYQYDYDLG